MEAAGSCEVSVHVCRTAVATSQKASVYDYHCENLMSCVICMVEKSARVLACVSLALYPVEGI